MKRKFIMFFFVILVVLQSICLAGGSLSTRDGDDGQTAAVGAGMRYGSGSTGTRYILRIDKIDIGGTKKDEYYITHFNDGNKAIIGYGGNNAKEYANPFNQTPDSTQDKSGKYNAQNGNYRIVTKWFGEGIYTDNFGLSEANVNILINMVKEQATKLKDKTTLDQIKTIKDGNARLEIRAEIVYTSISFDFSQGWMGDAYKKIGNLTISISGKDMRTFSLTLKKGMRQLLPAFTYREGMEIRKKIVAAINSQAGTNFAGFANIFGDDCLVNTMKSVPTRLYEADAPYVTSEYGTTGAEINQGWDYIRYEATYITLEYKDVDTKKDIIKSKEFTLLSDENTYEYEDLTSKKYSYTGKLTADSKEKKANSVTIKNDKKTHLITFWYKKNIPKKINVQYRCIDDKYNLSEIKTIKKTYDYNTEISADNTVVDRDKHPKQSKPNDNILKNGYEYAGVCINTASKKNLKNETKVSVSPDDKTTTIIFCYKKKAIIQIHVRVIGVCVETGAMTRFKDFPNLKVPVDNTYKASDYTWTGYKLQEGNNVKTIEGKLTWKDETPDSSGGTAKVSVTESDYTDDKSMILVVFFYEPEKTEIEVKYRDYNNGTPLIIDNSYDYAFKLNVGSKQTVTVNSHPTITNINSVIVNLFYEYKGVQVDSGAISASSETSKEISSDNKCIVFYYVKLATADISIRYREWDGTDSGKLIPGIEGKYDTVKKISSAVYITRDGDVNTNIINKGFTYKGVNLGETKANITNENTIYVSVADNVVTFWYEIYCDIKVIGVFQPSAGDYGTQLQIKTDRQVIPIAELTYKPSEWNNYEYLNQYKVFYGTTSYGGDNSSCITGEEVTIKNITDASPTNMRTILIVFYYDKLRTITIYYKEVNTKEEIPEMPAETKKDAGTYTKAEIEDYVYMGVELTKPVAVERKKDISVVIPKDYQNYEIIFWYIKEDHLPKLIYGATDPNPVPVPTYEELKKKIKDQDRNSPNGNHMLYPNDMNNQSITQTNNEWVLDERGNIIVRFAASKATNPRFDLKLVLPFYVEYIGKTSKTFTFENIKPVTYALKDETDYIGYQMYIPGFRVLINTIEKSYNNELTGYVKFMCDEFEEGKYVEGVEKNSITVVGAVYNFNITNLNGSNITGDEKWHQFLFSSGQVYNATSLPIGQSNTAQKDNKYFYGIKKGTRFYFSLNTKGIKTREIEILPKYYYYNSEGELKGEVLLCDNNGNTINSVRTTSIRDTNRLSEEYKSELLKGISFYTGRYTNTLPGIGTFEIIKIPTRLRMPFVNYGIYEQKFDEISPKDDITLLKVNHWYADFLVPNNANFYSIENHSKMPNDGYVVVCFSIKTKDIDGNYYLAYNLSSPFKQSNNASEWKYEKGNTSSNITLPNQKVVSEPWTNLLSTVRQSGYAPVIIYQCNASTTQNVDSIGTH